MLGGGVLPTRGFFNGTALSEGRDNALGSVRLSVRLHSPACMEQYQGHRSNGSGVRGLKNGQTDSTKRIISLALLC